MSDPHDRCTWDCTVKGTGKKKYATREEAIAFAKRHETRFGPQYPYLCTAPVTPNKPAHWHLSSKPAYVPGGKAESAEPKRVESLEADTPVSPVKEEKLAPATKEIMDLLDGSKTAQEIVNIVGGDRPRVYRIAKKRGLPYKRVWKPRRPVPYELNELETLKAKRDESARQTDELDRQIVVLSGPNIELLDNGAEISVDGDKTVLDEDRCRRLMEQTRKLNRYLR